MLKTITEKVGKVFAWALICLIVLSFAIWGIGDVFRGRIDNSVATVGGSKISYEEFRDAVRNQLSRTQHMLGGQAVPDELKAQIEQSVLNDMIANRLIAMESYDLGLLVGSDSIANIIAMQPNFQGEDGKFSSDKFRAFLNQIRQTESQYVTYLKMNMANNILVRAVSAGHFVPDIAARNLVAFSEEKRTVDYVSVPTDYIKEVPEATEADLNEFYSKNKNMFLLPEKRNISYVEINSDIGNDVKVSEEQVKAEYEKEKRAFVPEESRDIEQLLFDNEKDAKAAYEELKSSTASLKSYKKGEYSDLDKVGKGDLPGDLSKSVFSLAKNSVSQPVNSSLGWHIFRVSNISKSEYPAYEKLKSGIRSNLQDKLSSEFVYKLNNSIEDELAGGGKLDEVAKKYNFNVKKLTGFTADHKASDITGTEGFIKTTFTTEQGNSSGVIGSKTGKSYFVITVDSITPARVKALDEVRGTVQEKWKQTKKDELLRKAAREIADNVSADNGKKDLAAAVNGTSLKVSTSSAFPRYPAESNSMLPRQLVEDVFKLKIGTATPPEKAENGSYYIAQLKSVAAGNKTNKEGEVSRIKHELSAQFAQDLMEQYLSYLRTKHKVSTNNALISGAGS